MARDFLNEFEEMVLTNVAVLEDDAYGAAITLALEKWLERKVTLSAVHVVLYKLEDKGYVKSKVGGATSERGGRSKRIYTITNTGTAVLKTMREKRLELWGMLPQFKTV